MCIAIFIFIVGLVLLLTNLGIITTNVWDILWPIFIMLFGISLVWHKKCHCGICGKGDKCCKKDKEEEKQNTP